MFAAVRSVLPPPAWASRLHTGDPDAASAYFQPQLGTQVRVTDAGSAYRFEFQRLSGRALDVGLGSVSAAQTLQGVPDRPILHLQWPPGSVYRHGRHDARPATDATVSLLPPGWLLTRRSGPGAMLALQARPGALERVLARLQPGDGGHWLLGFGQLELAPAERADWREALAALARATRPEAGVDALDAAEQGVLERWARLALRAGVAQRLGGPALERLPALEAWITAHLSETFTLDVLCRQAGVGPRCLQQAFARARGVSPMRYVTERRLLAAWQRLHRGGPGTGVTEVALEFGFDHLGRFARLYREDIGEPPSRTLARARQRQRSHPSGGAP